MNCCFLLYLKERQMRYLAGEVFLSHSIFSRERLLFLERYLFLFSCLRYRYQISSLYKFLSPVNTLLSFTKLCFA